MLCGVAAYAQTIIIHHIGPFTGQLAAANAEAVKGAEIYFDHINAQGGINGKKLSLKNLTINKTLKIAQDFSRSL
jgi:branched-chain amino acid transport system substrate-binding protein